jgi:hypothetical protein
MAGATTVQKFSISDLAKVGDDCRASVDDVRRAGTTTTKRSTYISLKVRRGEGIRKNDMLTIRQIGGSVDNIISVAGHAQLPERRGSRCS